MTDYINYTLAQSEVPNMYILGGVPMLWQIGQKTGFPQLASKF